MLYLDGLCLCLDDVWLELLLLLRRRLHLFARLDTAGARHDGPLRGDVDLYLEYVDQCDVRRHDGHWDH